MRDRQGLTLPLTLTLTLEVGGEGRGWTGGGELGTRHNLPLGTSGEPRDGVSQPGRARHSHKERGPSASRSPRARQDSSAWTVHANRSWQKVFSSQDGGKLVLDAPEHLEQILNETALIHI